MNKEKKYIIYNALVSALIGLVIGMVEVISPIFDMTTFYILTKNALVGLLVGVSIRNFSIYFWDKLSEKQMYLYSSLILTIIVALPKVLEHFIFDKEIFFQMKDKFNLFKENLKLFVANWRTTSIFC